MPQVYNNERSKIDISFMPSLECNHRCSFCMYRCSPEAKGWELPLHMVRELVGRVNWEDVNSIGFYGGEPMCNLELYAKFYDTVKHLGKPMFTISNGSFTSSRYELDRFWDFIKEHPMRVVVSGTDEHKAYQRKQVVDVLRGYPGLFLVKDGDEMHPMGRLQTKVWSCTRKCIWVEVPSRIALFPTGDIIFQNCDGVYPVIGTFETPWEELKKNITRIRSQGCHGFETTVNDLTRGLA